MFGHEARGELLAARNGRRIRAYREASGIGPRDEQSARTVPGTVAAAMICVARGFIAVMLRRHVIAAVVRMYRRRLVVSSVKIDRHRRNRARRNERDQEEHDQSLH